MTFVVAALLLGGTTVQMITSLQELATTRRRELDALLSESDAINKVPFFDFAGRRRLRRELKALRDPATESAIRHMNGVMTGWLLLWSGAVLAMINAVVS